MVVVIDGEQDFTVLVSRAEIRIERTNDDCCVTAASPLDNRTLVMKMSWAHYGKLSSC